MVNIPIYKVSYMSGACLGFLNHQQYGCWREGKNRPMGELSRLQRSPKDSLKNPTAKKTQKAGWNKKIQCKNFPINKWSWKSWWPPRHGGQIISQRRVTWDLELRMNSLCRTGKRLKSSRTSRMRKRIWTPQELWGRHPMNLQGINWDVCMFTYIKWL